MITSKLLEDAVKIQTCNYVVRYDSPKNFQSYVQAKCIASSKKSNFIIMVPNSLKFGKIHQEYVKIEDQIDKVSLLCKFLKIIFFVYKNMNIYFLELFKDFCAKLY